MGEVQSSTRTIWSLDPSHSEIGFKVKHLMITNVRGTFKEYKSAISTTGEDFASAEITLSIYPSSINTGDATRDNHLKSLDFFDVSNFDVIDFKGIKLEKKGDSSYVLDGDFTIKHVTKRIKLDVEYNGIVKDPYGAVRAAFEVSGKILRKEFGLTWNQALETGGLMVGDEVTIKCEIQLVKQP
jgi:polyisoprenoid-binding protein YceI